MGPPMIEQMSSQTSWTVTAEQVGLEENEVLVMVSVGVTLFEGLHSFWVWIFFKTRECTTRNSYIIVYNCYIYI